MQRVAGVLEGASVLAERIRSAYVELKDVEGELSSLAGRIEGDPSRLEAVDNRIGAICELMRRYGVATSDDLLELGNDLGSRLEAITMPCLQSGLLLTAERLKRGLCICRRRPCMKRGLFPTLIFRK